MKKFSLCLLIITTYHSSYGNERLNRIPKNIISPNQHNLGSEANTTRNESQLLNFIETTMDTYVIPGVSVSIVKGGNIVWDKHFGYANIDENILVNRNTMFILSSSDDIGRVLLSNSRNHEGMALIESSIF
jgi:hypothetical protein